MYKNFIMNVSGWGPSSFAKLVYNSHFTMVYGRYNYSIHGVYKPTYNWGATHCMDMVFIDYLPIGISIDMYL